MLAGMISVATLTAVLLAPASLTRLGTQVAHAEYTVVTEGVGSVSARWTLGHAARLAQQQFVRHRLLQAPTPRTRPVASPWRALAPGIGYREIRLVARTGDALQVHQVRLDPARADLRVLYSGRPQPVEAAARRAKCLAAVNASYFDEDRRPLGYLKIAGRVINSSVASGAAFTGVFTMRGRTPRIVPRAMFDGHRVDTALQAGPRLVADGASTVGLRETRSFRQSGIAVTRRGEIVIYATDGSYRGMSWREMQELLTGPVTAGGIDPRDVLNLDGGSSSQIYVHGPGIAVSGGFPTAVPVVLAMSGKE